MTMDRDRAHDALVSAMVWATERGTDQLSGSAKFSILPQFQ